jgi:hypothetical protein
LQPVVTDFGGKVKEDGKDRYPDNYSRRPNESDYYVATNETTQPNRQTLQTKALIKITEVDSGDCSNNSNKHYNFLAIVISMCFIST